MNPLLKSAIALSLAIPAISDAQTATAQAVVAQTTTPPVTTAIPPTEANKEASEITVHGAREAQATVERKETYDERDIANTNAFDAQEFVDTLPPGPTGTTPVILIDGKETSRALSSIPADMIAKVEVNLDGERPDGQPRAEGHVINIIRHRNYVGANFDGSQRGSFEGGGGRREVRGQASYKKGEVEVTFMPRYNENFSLLASERDYSRDQDHTAWGGRDFRLPWGETASVQALSGTLNGVVDGNGTAVSTAITPASGGFTPGDFIAGPAGVTSASGLQRFNSSDYQYLESPNRQPKLELSLNYPVTERTSLGANISYETTNRTTLAAPPVTNASGNAIVPAAYNPFGQDVAIGMIHTGFGPVRGTSESRTRSFGLTGNGLLGEKFNWNADVNLNKSDSAGLTRELDPVAFAAALAATDPALRFNPFDVDDALYANLSRLRTNNTDSTSTTARATLRGPISEGWVGPLYFNAGASYNKSGSESIQPALSDRIGQFSDSDNVRRSANTSLSIPLFRTKESAPPPAGPEAGAGGGRGGGRGMGMMGGWGRGGGGGRGVANLTLRADWNEQDQLRLNNGVTTRTDLVRTAYNAEFRAPWIVQGALPGLFGLETTVALGVATQSGQDDADTSRLGLMWSPLQPIRLRLTAEEQDDQPRFFFDYQSVTYNNTLFDRFRNVPTATNVEVVRNISGILPPSFRRSRTVDLEFTPPQFTRFSVNLTYNVRNRGDILRQLSAQDVVDNEPVLPGRVIRAQPTADDIAAGQPGAILSVDVTPLSAGRSRNETLEFSTRFRGTDKPWGTLDFSLRAQKNLEIMDELLPGVPFVTSNDRDAPPEWTTNGSVNWRRGPWQASTSLAHQAEGYYAGVPYAAYSTVNFTAGYTFQRPFIGSFGQRTTVRLEIGNLLDESPPRVDTLRGFTSGSALGRTFQLNIRMPLGSLRGGPGGMRRGGWGNPGGEGGDGDGGDRDRGDFDRSDFPRGDFPRGDMPPGNFPGRGGGRR